MDLHRLNLRHLAALEATVRLGSVSAAARAVNLTQPAVTQGLAKLESLLGITLFDRVPAGMVATEEARLLSARVQRMMRLLGTRSATTAQLRAFLAVARAGSYVGAAAATGLADASLHRAVADLSVVMGAALVVRRGHQMALTPRGVALARDFKLALAELRAGLGEVEAVRGRETGRISVGAMPLARARVLPDAIGVFHEASPQVDIRVMEGSYLELAGSLRNGEIEFMIGAMRDLPQMDDLLEIPLFMDRPVVVGRSDHPLASRPAIVVADLVGFPWIVSAEGTPLNTLWRSMFEREDLDTPRVSTECGSVIATRRLLQRSDSLSLLSPDELTVEFEAGILVRIMDAPASAIRTIGLTMRRDWRPTAAQTCFIDILREVSLASS